MPKLRLWGLIGVVVLLAGFSLMTGFAPMVEAQRATPAPYTPGFPLALLTPTQAPFSCFPPLPMKKGETAFILPGVNIRNSPTMSSALVWNTIYDNRDPETGLVVDDPKAVPVTILEGPVCDDGYNWWKVGGLQNIGWVAEGRPDEDGYWVIPGNPLALAPCTPLYNLAVGKPVELHFNVRIREAPSMTAATLTVVPHQTPIRIIGASQCVEGMLWWVVQAEVLGATYTGWMAESDNGQQLIMPADLPSSEDGNLCALPLPLTPGQRAYVDYRDDVPKSLRAEPTSESTLLFTLVNGVPFVVEGGPVCSQNMNWWKIRILSNIPVTGWFSEGSPAIGYWISTIDPDEFAD